MEMQNQETQIKFRIPLEDCLLLNQDVVINKSDEKMLYHIVIKNQAIKQSIFDLNFSNMLSFFMDSDNPFNTLFYIRRTWGEEIFDYFIERIFENKVTLEDYVILIDDYRATPQDLLDVQKVLKKMTGNHVETDEEKYEDIKDAEVLDFLKRMHEAEEKVKKIKENKEEKSDPLSYGRIMLSLHHSFGINREEFLEMNLFSIIKYFQATQLIFYQAPISVAWGNGLLEKGYDLKHFVHKL